MKVPVTAVPIKSIKSISELYRAGEKPAYPFISWGAVARKMMHKRGPKPYGFNLYTDKGIYMLSLEYNLTELLEAKICVKDV